MTEAEIKVKIEAGCTAKDLLDEKCPTARKEFKAAVVKMNKLLERIRVEFPGANYYIDDSVMYLLLGESHNEETEDSQRELIAESNIMSGGSGGGW